MQDFGKLHSIMCIAEQINSIELLQKLFYLFKIQQDNTVPFSSSADGKVLKKCLPWVFLI